MAFRMATTSSAPWEMAASQASRMGSRRPAKSARAPVVASALRRLACFRKNVWADVKFRFRHQFPEGLSGLPKLNGS